MCSSQRLGLARRLLALSVSLAVVLSSYAFTIASPAKRAPNSSALNPSQAAATNELQLTSVSATATSAGVLLRWRTNSVPDNIGFNIYRVKDGQRTRANKEIIPGALFGPGTPALMRAGYSYAWFDRGGSAASTYFIESVNVAGTGKMHSAISPVTSNAASEFEQTPEALSANGSESTDAFEKGYPAAEMHPTDFGGSTIEDQWAIAAQTALKISISKDGWYRVTQPQMVAAGFNPTVDIRNLRLFAEAKEVAINTSQVMGPFGSGDYIEFYGTGLDVPTTDKHIYYLIAGTVPGKRIGENQLDGDPGSPPPGPTPPISPPPQASPPPESTPPPVDTPPTSPPVSAPPVAAPAISRPVLQDPIFNSSIQDFSLLGFWRPGTPVDKRETKAPESLSANGSSAVSNNGNAPADYSRDYSTENLSDASRPSEVKQQPQTAADNSTALASSARSVTGPAPKFATAAPQTALKADRQSRKRARTRKQTKRTARRQLKQEYSHALVAVTTQLPNFDYTVQIKDRLVYFSNLLNGDEENFFGRVISSPVTQTLTLPNPDLTATAPAKLEFALQGVMNLFASDHDVSVAFNGVTIGTVHFQALEHPIRTFSVPIAQLHSGDNSLTFTKTSSGEVCIVDYIRITYPHAFKADTNSLKFNLRGTQTVKVDNFSTPSVRLIDYTDPFNVTMTKPVSEPSGPGYAITVPRTDPPSKGQRLLYAIQQGTFAQAAALSLSQPSTLNASSNAADFLIISYKDFIPSFTANVGPPSNTSLVAQRLSQGLAVSIVDVDDVYDEFSYGLHGPQAVKDFIGYALTHWATPPRYIILAGDASLDPRNYEGVGNFDLVPTKLVDATYSETVTDDWLADFHGDPGGGPDGIADVPVGRLPFRTVTDANLVVSKIVNFVPQPQPQSAMLLADEDADNIYGFAATNDAFQNLLPPTMNVLRLNRAPQPPGVPSQTVVKADIVNGFNSGPALVNYSGHGNVDVWTGANLFLTADALTLTNGSHLPFVVVMDCLNGYFQDPTVLSLSEAWLKAPNGGAVAAFASSGLTIAQGQHDMGHELYTQLYSGAPMALGDAIKIAKGATFDIDVKRTWIFFGDPSLKIR